MGKFKPSTQDENLKPDEVLTNELEAKAAKKETTKAPLLGNATSKKHWKQEVKSALDKFFNENPAATITALLSFVGNDQKKEITLDNQKLQYALLFGTIYNDQKEVFKIEKEELIEITNKLK